MELTELRQRVTELEKQENGLAWTKNRLEQHTGFLDLVLESLPYPFYVIDAFDYSIKLANSAAQFGRLSKNSTCYALTHNSDIPCTSARHPCPIEKIKKTKRPVTVEHLHYDKAGNPRNVEVHAFPVFDNEGGDVSHIIEYVVDITDRKQIEDELKWELAVNSALSESYKQLVSPRASFEDMTNTLLNKAKSLTGSKHGYVSSIDRTTGDNVGHTLDNMLKGQCKVSGKNRKTTFPRGEDGSYIGLNGHSLNTLEPFFTNSPENHKARRGVPKGHIPIKRLLSVPVMLGKESVGQIVLANKDAGYTERELVAIRRLSELYALAIQRQQADEELRKLSLAVEQSQVSVVITDLNGAIEYVNPKFTEVTGYGFKEAFGQNPRILSARLQPHEFYKKMWDKIKAGRVWKGAFINKKKNGDIYWENATISAIRNNKDQITHYVAVKEDITERKRAEEALQKARDELERRVEERTAELVKSYKEKDFIRDTFGAYMSDEVVTEILASSERVKLGGELREMTVLVSDLRGFTSITESMEAHEIVKILNRYLEKMIDIIVRHEGTIDEFMGDGILVFFGAPRLLPDHTREAVACALEMQESMTELSRENLSLGLPELEMGIGINCGQLVVGNIGSERRKKYGAVGNPINEAFRVEGNTRPGEILVTQAVKDKLGDKLQIGSCWRDNLKGIGNTPIYQVIGMKEN